MEICLIGAMASNRVIGANGEIPWHLPRDLKRFRRLTLGYPVVMGRLTYESIQRPLPHRQNIILSRNPAYQVTGCTVVQSPQAVLEEAGEVEKMFVIGGEQIYALFLPLARRIYLTILDDVFEGDAFFPPYDTNEWQIVARERYMPTSKNKWAHTYFTLQRQ